VWLGTSGLLQSGCTRIEGTRIRAWHGIRWPALHFCPYISGTDCNKPARLRLFVESVPAGVQTSLPPPARPLDRHGKWLLHAGARHVSVYQTTPFFPRYPEVRGGNFPDIG